MTSADIDCYLNYALVYSLYTALIRRYVHSHITHPLRRVKLFVFIHVYNRMPETTVDKLFYIKSFSAIGSRDHGALSCRDVVSCSKEFSYIGIRVVYECGV